MNPDSQLLRRLTGPLAAGLVLACFWAGLLASLREKSITYDELAHATAGYSYWKFDDYRLNPENGNLPQRLMALPLVLGGARFAFPPLDTAAWRSGDEWAVGDQWFHQMGHNVPAMLFAGRAAMSLVAVALGLLVWLWSRRLFGPPGGMLSLLLYVLSPTVLANGALMTSDTTAAFFFLAAAWTLGALAERITPGRILLGGLCLGGLFVSKMSALLVVPLAAILVIARLRQPRPLEIVLGRTHRVASRAGQALAFAGVAATEALLTLAVIWACYGFRYTAFRDGPAGSGQFQRSWEVVSERPDPIDLVGRLSLSEAQRNRLIDTLRTFQATAEPWSPARVAAADVLRREILSPVQRAELARLEAAPAAAAAVRLADFVRRHRLLPEAYVYGQLYAWRFSQMRFTFFNGATSVTGTRWFFPYAFLVKTPLTVPALGLLALAAAFCLGRKADGPVAAFRRPAPREILPLAALAAIYWIAVLAGHLNIGQRHLLATYPPFFVLTGAAAGWLEAGRRRPMLAGATAALLAGLALETAYRFPDYLAYFNVLAGGPAHAYRHLVDSSLDWGQDLPGVRRYLEAHPAGGPFYLSYFGTGNPRTYGITAARLYSAPGQDVPPPLFVLRLPRDRARAAVADLQREHPAYDVAALTPAADNTVEAALLKRPDALRWRGGTYLVSATMLQPINYSPGGPLGPWNARYEAEYREMDRAVAPLLGSDDAARFARLREHTPAEWETLLTRYEAFRFARLTAFLRKREPDDEIGYTILVYRLDAAAVEQALEGPPPELGEDLPRALAQNRGPVAGARRREP